MGTTLNMGLLPQPRASNWSQKGILSARGLGGAGTRWSRLSLALALALALAFRLPLPLLPVLLLRGRGRGRGRAKEKSERPSFALLSSLSLVGIITNFFFSSFTYHRRPLSTVLVPYAQPHFILHSVGWLFAIVLVVLWSLPSSPLTRSRQDSLKPPPSPLGSTMNIVS